MKEMTEFEINYYAGRI